MHGWVGYSPVNSNLLKISQALLEAMQSRLAVSVNESSIPNLCQTTLDLRLIEYGAFLHGSPDVDMITKLRI